ncbi:MAG: NTP transferase domain-containing protein [Candidatus Aminicenantes bacterium]|nr:NTP transferase domain-containing protein [Candidatus Aminicenantes bacterium]
MDALILAAGDGTRLFPLTKDKPKVMIKIYGIPILERALYVLKNVGVKRAVIVIGYKGEVIKRYFNDEWGGMQIIYKETDWHEDGILKSFIKAKEAFKNRFIFLCGDTIPEEKSLKSALEKEGDVVIGARNLNEDSVVAQVSKNGTVKNIGMRKDMRKFNATVAGISVNEPVFFDAVEDCIKNNKFDRPDAIAWMIKKGHKVNSSDISNDTLLEIDSFDDLKAARKVIFERAVRQRIKNPGLFKKLFNFPISKPLTKLVARTNLKPNQITFISLLLFIAAGIFFSLKHFIIGGILCYSGAMFDAVDGKISRLKFKSSYLGKFFDSISDRFCELSVVIGLTFGIYFSSHKNLIFLLGLISTFFILGRFYSQGLYYEYMNERIHSSKKWKGSKSAKIVELANRDLNFFIVLISCLVGYPIVGLGYMAFSAALAFFIRTTQTMIVLKTTKNQ